MAGQGKKKWVRTNRMKDQHKDIVKKILYHCGYYSWQERLRVPSENRLLIPVYHDFARDKEQDAHWSKKNTPSESQFETVLVTLKKHFRIISVEDAVREIRNTGALKGKSAAITLDDGYVSNYEIVFPLLKKHGVTATIYLSTDWIDRKSHPWWMTLTSMLDCCDITAAAVAKVDKILGWPVGLNAKTPHNPAHLKQILRSHIESVLRSLDETTRDGVLHELRDTLFQGVEFVSRIEEPMTWEQIKEMAAYGITFGAHTCSHPNLSHVDLETAEREIVGSKRVIERRLGVDISGFAYPYGNDLVDYQRLRGVLEKHGFLYACTTRYGHVSAKSNLYLLHRIGLPLTTSPALVTRSLSMGYATTQGG